MLKSDFHFDEELMRKLSREIAVERVDEEIAHHPNLVHQREQLLKAKENEVENELQQGVIDIVNDLTLAGEYLIGWFQNLPPEKLETLKKEFNRAGEIFQSDWFQNQLRQSIENPLEKASPLQKVLKLSDTTLQTVYEAGCHLQRENDFMTGRAVFRFLVFLNPLIADFWLCLGYCFSNLRDFNEACEAYKYAGELTPTEPNPFYFSAVNCTLQHDYEKAGDYCEKCLQVINGKENLQTWRPVVVELQQFILQKKGGNL